jgi:hypothetical protein
MVFRQMPSIHEPEGLADPVESPTEYPPYVNLQGSREDPDPSKIPPKPVPNSHRGRAANDQYDILTDDPSPSGEIPGRSIVSTSRRCTATSDSEDGGLDGVIGRNSQGKVRFRDPRMEIGAAYYDYQAIEQDELSLKRGSVVEIIQRDW